MTSTEEPTLVANDEEDFARQKPKRTSSLDGSLHVPSTHRAGKRPNPLDVSHSQRAGDAGNAEEQEQEIEGHSATELTDDIDLLNPNDNDDDNNDDDEDGDSFCDADDTSTPDIKCLRREMSVTPDDLEDFIVEFGDEIAEAANAYYDDEDGDKIVATPRVHVVPKEGEKDNEGEAAKEGEEQEQTTSKKDNEEQSGEKEQVEEEEKDA